MKIVERDRPPITAHDAIAFAESLLLQVADDQRRQEEV